MDAYGLWITVGVPILIGLFAAKLKGKGGLIILWVYLWGISGQLAIKQWHFHQQWLGTVTQARSGGYGESFLADTSASHYQSLYGGVATATAGMLIPVIWYLLDRRKERVAGKLFQAI